MEVFAESGSSSSSSSSDEEEQVESEQVEAVQNSTREEIKSEQEEPKEEEDEQQQTTTTSNEEEEEEEEEDEKNIQHNLFGSEDEGEENAEFDDTKKEETTTAQNNTLFGEQDDDDDDDDDAEFDDTATGIKGSSRPIEDKEDGNDIKNEGEDEDQREELRSRHMEVVNYPNPTKTTMHMTKLPNMLHINLNAFDESSFNANLEEEEYRGHVHNMIRWRYKTDPGTGEFIRDDDNRLIRESNARFVRWSDGSTSLHVNEETFEIEDMKSTPVSAPSSEEGQGSNDNVFPGLNGYLYLTQKATTSNKESNTILQCLGPITSKMNARPSSKKKDAHRNLTLAVRQKNLKKARIEEFNVIQDPEKEKNKRIKNKDDLFKTEHRTSSSGHSNRQSNRPSNNNSGYNQRRKNNKYSREERNYDSVNISALKRMNEDMMNTEDPGTYDYGSAGSAASDDDWEKKKLLDFKKARKGGRKVVEEEEDDDENDGEVEEDDDDDDEEGQMMSNRKRNRQAVIEEDDED